MPVAPSAVGWAGGSGIENGIRHFSPGVIAADRAIHFLGDVSGWGFPIAAKGSVSMTVRLHYEGGMTGDHPLKNGEHFADYDRRVDVPGSKFAFRLRNLPHRADRDGHHRRETMMWRWRLARGDRDRSLQPVADPESQAPRLGLAGSLERSMGSRP
jgi:hypothetical protein